MSVVTGAALSNLTASNFALIQPGLVTMPAGRVEAPISPNQGDEFSLDALSSKFSRIVSGTVALSTFTGCSGAEITASVTGGILALISGLAVYERSFYQRMKPRVLEALREGPKSGLELMDELKTNMGIYGVLRQMVHEGLLETEVRYEALEIRGGRPRIYYKLSGQPDRKVGFLGWFKDFVATLFPKPVKASL